MNNEKLMRDEFHPATERMLRSGITVIEAAKKHRDTDSDVVALSGMSAIAYEMALLRTMLQKALGGTDRASEEDDQEARWEAAYRKQTRRYEQARQELQQMAAWMRTILADGYEMDDSEESILEVVKSAAGWREEQKARLRLLMTLEGMVMAVRDLHRDRMGVCTECSLPAPCPTVATLDKWEQR